MADKGMYSTTDLLPHLEDRSIHLSSTQVYRLVVQSPERLNVRVLVALCDILGCTPNDLIEPVAGEAAPRKKAAGGTGETHSAQKTEQLRPRRARITDDDAS